MTKLFLTVLGSAVMLESLGGTSTTDLGVGDTAPRITITEWVTRPLTGEHPFKDKTVILEFWATWCAPCIAQIPHLNALSDQFASDSVLFVSLTNEKKEKIQQFLTKKEMKTHVALDTTKTTMGAYGVRGIPMAFLIDSEGFIRWQGHAAALSAGFLGTFLETGQVPESAASASGILKGSQASTSEDIYELTVTETVSTGGSQHKWNDNSGISISFVNYDIAAIVSALNSVSSSRLSISGLDTLPHLDIEFHSRNINDIGHGRKELLARLEQILGFRTWSQVQKQPILVFSMAEPDKVSKYHEGEKVASHSGSNLEEWIGTYVSSADLAATFESFFHVIVSDSTALTGKYDFSFPITDMNLALLHLRDEFGIEATWQNQQVEMTVLEFVH
jgi:thiol-disulfide isomerase/thioredoxin